MKGSVIVLLVVVAVACTPSPNAGPTLAPGTIVPSPSLDGAPIGYSAFESEAAPYRGCYPENWDVQADWSAGGGRGDAFIGGHPGDLPEVVSVLMEPAPDHDTERYFQSAIENLRSTGAGVERVGTSTVQGVRAELIRFARLTSAGQRYEVRQAIWAADGYGWVISASVPPASVDEMSAAMSVMLACFRSR